MLVTVFEVVLGLVGLALVVLGIYGIVRDKFGAPTSGGAMGGTISIPLSGLIVMLGLCSLGFAVYLSANETSQNAIATPTSSATSIPTSPPPQPTGITASPSPTPDALPSAPTITIIKPLSGSYVNLNDDITVQLSGVGVSRQVWLLVQLGSQVYPQGPCNTLSLTVTDCPGVRFGDPGMRFGTPYKVTAVLVKLQDNNKYNKVYASGFSAQSPPVSPILSSSSITVYGRE